MDMEITCRIDEAVDWFTDNQPATLEKLKLRGVDIAEAIERAHIMGGSEVIGAAKTMVGMADAFFPVIAIAIKTANRRRWFTRIFSLFSRLATIAFSLGTLAVIKSSVDKAQWLAMGSTSSTFLAILADYSNRIGDSKGFTAERAVDKLVSLEFDLHMCRHRIENLLETGATGKPLADCVNQGNKIFGEINALTAKLGVVGAVEYLHSLNKKSNLM